MNTFEKKWKLFTLHILSFFLFFLLSLHELKLAEKKEEIELHAEIISLVAETCITPKSSQISKLVNQTKIKILMLQQQFPPTCVGHFSQSNGYKGLPKQSLIRQRAAWQLESCLGTWRIWIRIHLITLFHIANEVLIIGPQNIHSRVYHLSYWWHFLSYGVTVNSLVKKRRESKNGSVVTLGSVTWDVHAAVSRPAEI